jgi:hypothetical protein
MLQPRPRLLTLGRKGMAVGVFRDALEHRDRQAGPVQEERSRAGLSGGFCSCFDRLMHPVESDRNGRSPQTVVPASRAYAADSRVVSWSHLPAELDALPPRTVRVTVMCRLTDCARVRTMTRARAGARRRRRRRPVRHQPRLLKGPSPANPHHSYLCPRRGHHRTDRR